MQPLVAPARLIADHRVEFRRSVLELLERAVQEEQSTVDVDLGGTMEMDASGFGVLVHAPRAIVDTMRLTRLDSLFEFSPTS